MRLIPIRQTVPVRIRIQRVGVIIIHFFSAFQTIAVGIVILRISSQLYLLCIGQSVFVRISVCVRNTIGYRIILCGIRSCYVYFLIVGQTIPISIGIIQICTDHILINVRKPVTVAVKKINRIFILCFCYNKGNRLDCFTEIIRN